jgi:hypothetical protein
VTQLPLKPRPPAQKGRQIIAYLFVCLFVCFGSEVEFMLLSGSALNAGFKEFKK